MRAFAKVINGTIEGEFNEQDVRNIAAKSGVFPEAGFNAYEEYRLISETEIPQVLPYVELIDHIELIDGVPTRKFTQSINETAKAEYEDSLVQQTSAIIQSPNGTAFKIMVNDDGQISTEPLEI